MPISERALLLSVTDLQSGYGAVRVLRGVHLAVDEGEIVAILGANGAGKTTALRAISGVLPTWAGEVRFAGTRLRGQPPETRAKLGLGHVPEGRGILATLTVGENLDLGTGLRRDGAAAVQADRNRLLELFTPLAHRLDSPASQLSGGQQQMLAVARAILARPKLVMVDELSFGLAPVLVDELFGLIKELRDQGTTFLLVEQHAGALRISDRAYVMSGGRTVVEGRPEELTGERLVRSYLGTSEKESTSGGAST
jgi:branched-chain amino acid transport system ATP-binding protein